VGDALQLEVAVAGRAVVEQEHGAAPSGEELLETEHLASIPQRVASEQA
jgi:hypothetical protein